MAIALHDLSTATASKTTGTTLAAATLTISVGDDVVVAFSHDTTAGTYSCADDAGNTYVQELARTRIDIDVRFFRCRSATAAQTNGNVTITHPSLVARAMKAASFSNSDGAAPSTTNNNGGTTANPSTGSVTPPANDSIVVAAVGYEGPLTNWSADDAGDPWAFFATPQPVGTGSGGAVDSNIHLAVAYDIQTTATARNYNPTLTQSRDWAGIIMVLGPRPPGNLFQPRWVA